MRSCVSRNRDRGGQQISTYRNMLKRTESNCSSNNFEPNAWSCWS